MGTGDKIRIATHAEVTWLEPSFVPAVCPNCGTSAPVRQYLDIDYRPPDAAYKFVLQICPHCTVRFVDNTQTMDYSDQGLIEIGWNAYQVQLGAGIWPISAPLTRIQKPTGARVLEIGGAYGFGLDFCVRARGWQGEGYDPSPLAAFGARELGLTIHQEYFEEKDLSSGPWDVVLATELVEHLEHPPAFFSLMRRAMANDGILVLTTPDAECITPSLDASAFMSLLSPGAHLVLQTETSLRNVLAAAGFKHVVVVREPLSLVAYASPAPFVLNEDETAARAMYRHYLMERSKLTAPASHLCFGFAGRGLFEAANEGDYATAEAAWAILVSAAREHFNLDLETMQSLPEGVDDASLAELTRLIPLGLGMILFGRSMHLLNSGVDRTALTPVLRNAGRAVAALQNALAKRSLSDGLSINIHKIIECEILLCLAESADPDCVPGLVELGDTVTGWRGFVALVNAGALDLAGQLKAALLPDMPSGDISHDLRRNILLSLANFVLAPGGETMRAFDYAQVLRELGRPNDDIILAAFTRLVNNGRYEEALNITAAYDVGLLARQAAVEKNGQDARLAQMVLDLAVGDPAEIPHRLKGMEIEPARRDVLLLEAFIRLVNASRYDEALAFICDYEIPALAELRGGEAGRNAGLAQMVLDLAVGDPAEIPHRLKGMEIESVRRDVLLLEAFIRLVNASRYDEALGFIHNYETPMLAELHGGRAGRDARLARMVLDLAVGDPAEIPHRLEGMKIESARRDVLLLEAFIRLVNASRYDEALGFIRDYEIPVLAERSGGEAGQNARLARMVLDLAVGDPAEIPHRLEGMEIESARRDVLLLEAFIRLVNASRYNEALAFIRDYEIPVLAERSGGETGRNARLARMVLVLAVGDPAEIPHRLEGMEIEPARRDVLLLEAFIRLVNASRYNEALAFIRDYEIPVLAERSGGETGRNARLARMVLDLAVGDPAEIPHRLEGMEIEPVRRDVLLLEAFIRLVNASRYDEALAYIRDYEIPVLAERSGGEPGRNARLARMVLDLAVGDPAEIPGQLAGLELPAERRETLLLEAFIRLANASRFDEATAFAEAHDVAELSKRHSRATGGNAAIALAVVDLAAGDPAQVVKRLDGVEMASTRRDELLFGAFTGLVNAARYDEAETLAGAADCFRHLGEVPGQAADDARVADVMLDLQRGRTEAAVEKIGVLAQGRADAAVLDGLYVDSFVRLVNEGKFAAAHGMAQGRAVERRLADHKPELCHDALAALLMLELQPGGAATRIPQRLEEALQGGLDEERVRKLALVSFVTLVNMTDFATARLLLHLVEPILIKFQQPYDESARNTLFAAGVLFLQERDSWRRSTMVFARLRDALVKRAPPGTTPDTLFWPALRGEVMALHRLNRGADATALLEAFIGIYPDTPDDLLKQIESHNA